MKRHVWMVVLVVLVAALLLVYSVTFIIDWKQIGIVKTFGSAGEPIYGAKDAGLHFKLPWPIQRLVRYDARELLLEGPYEEVPTEDKQNVLAAVFCTWRIRDAHKFLTQIGDVKRAEDSLRNMVRAMTKDVVAEYPLEQFVNVDPGEMKMAEIERRIRESVAAQAGEQYGVEIVALGIKTLGLPKPVTDKVIESQKEERNREAAAYRFAGEAVASTIRSRAETARDTILAFARRKADGIRAEGTRAAAEFYPQFRENEPFAIFMRELDFLRETLKENTVFLLDPSLQRSFGFFQEGPSLPPAGGEPATRPSGRPVR